MNNSNKKFCNARVELERVSPISAAGLARTGFGAVNMIIVIGLLQAALS